MRGTPRPRCRNVTPPTRLEQAALALFHLGKAAMLWHGFFLAWCSGCGFSCHLESRYAGADAIQEAELW